MNAHVSAILLGVNDMEKSKRFYTEGLGWKVQNDYKISVFFVPHGGSLVGFYGRGSRGGRWREPAGERLPRRGHELRRSQRGACRRGDGRGKEGRRQDPQARGEAAVE